MSSVLINAVNFNTPYCMEDKTINIKETTIEPINNIYELHEALGIDISFVQMFGKYKCDISKKTKTKLTENFCNFLLGPDGKNLENYIIFIQ